MDKDLNNRCKHFAEDVSECLHILSHDPSLALYRIQEHTRKSLPAMVEKRIEVAQIHSRLQGACYDLENAVLAVQSMSKSSATFAKIHEMLRSSMYYKQQLDYEILRSEDRRVRAFAHAESNDSLAAELRKSKSLGHLRAAHSASDLRSETSRSTLSTPVSELRPGTWSAGPSTTPTSPTRGGVASSSPSEASSADRLDEAATLRLDLAVDSDMRSSTPTSGADSSVDETERLSSSP